MKPEPEFKRLKDLNDKTKVYRTKVKVMHKGQPQEPKDRRRYQRLLLQDDQGFKVKATLFGNDIEAYSEALQRNGEYEISNAALTSVPAKYATRQNEFSMIINSQAKIDPINNDPSLLEPQYRSIASIPHDTKSDNLYDIIGVILFTGPTKKVKRTEDREDEVKEVHIMDPSSDHPFIISTWNEFARDHDDVLSLWTTSLPIVGFTALQARRYKVFTLSTTMSTSVILNPEGPKGQALQDWIQENQDVLATHRAKLIRILDTTIEPPTITLAELKDKKAHNTWQAERFYVNVSLPKVEEKNLKLYEGCSKCGKRCITSQTQSFSCTNCFSKDAQYVPRAILKAEAVDISGTMEFTFFSKEVQTLSALSTEELWKIKEDTKAITTVLQKIQSTVVRVEVGPTVALTTSRALIWAVRAVRLD